MFWISLVLLLSIILYRYETGAEPWEGDGDGNEGGSFGWDLVEAKKIRETPEMPKTSPSRYLSQEDVNVIARLANGDKSVSEQAVLLYRAYIDQGVPARACAAMRFMSEVDHPHPDIHLRRIYREEVLMENSHIFH